MDEQAKRNILRKINYGVFVVGAVDGDRMDASTVSWLSQCSFQPPMVMTAVRKDTQLHELIVSGRVFSANFLGADQKGVAEHFLHPQSQVGSKLSGVACRTGVTGAPILEDALGFVECRVREIISGGDHDVVIGEVVEAGVSGDGSLLQVADAGLTYGG